MSWIAGIMPRQLLRACPPGLGTYPGCVVVRSSLVVARSEPSGLDATPRTEPAWPLSVVSSVPAVASQSLNASPVATGRGDERHTGRLTSRSIRSRPIRGLLALLLADTGVPAQTAVDTAGHPRLVRWEFDLVLGRLTRERSLVQVQHGPLFPLVSGVQTGLAEIDLSAGSPTGSLGLGNRVGSGGC